MKHEYSHLTPSIGRYLRGLICSLAAIVLIYLAINAGTAMNAALMGVLGAALFDFGSGLMDKANIEHLDPASRRQYRRMVVTGACCFILVCAAAFGFERYQAHRSAAIARENAQSLDRFVAAWNEVGR